MTKGVIEQLDRDDTFIEYKQHNEFFREYYMLRANFVQLHAESISDLKLVRKTYEILYALTNWTISQLINIDNTKVEEINKRLKETFKLISQQKLIIAREQLEEIFIDLSKIHEESELIPKVRKNFEDQNKKFWEEENNRGMKEMKKAFFDLFTFRD